MRCDLARDVAAASARVRHPNQLQADQAVSLEHMQNVPERADHRVIADALDLLEARKQGRRGSKCGPVSASEASVDGKRKSPAFFVAALRQAQGLDHSFELVDILH